MSLLSNNTNYNPLYLEDATGLDADFDEAVLEQDTNEFLARKRAEKTDVSDVWSEEDAYER